MMMNVMNAMELGIVINAVVALNHKQKNASKTVISDGGKPKESANPVLLTVNPAKHQHSAKNVLLRESCMQEDAKLLAQLDIKLTIESATNHKPLPLANTITKIPLSTELIAN